MNDLEEFIQNGFVLKKQLFSIEEIQKLDITKVLKNIKTHQK